MTMTELRFNLGNSHIAAQKWDPLTTVQQQLFLLPALVVITAIPIEPHTFVLIPFGQENSIYKPLSLSFCHFPLLQPSSGFLSPHNQIN